MKVLHISDTHGFHQQVRIPDDVDMIIHTGDASNHINPILNIKEIEEFLEWYSAIDIEHKIYVAGNHDTSISQYPYIESKFKELNIHYLYNSSVTIEGRTIWGSPYTPTYGAWAFMKAKNVINRVWENIPDDVDILATHGPPKYILDSTINKEEVLEAVGDGSLRKAIAKRNIRYHVFGHIHNCQDVTNTGSRVINNTTYINSAAVKDGRFDLGIIYQGTIFYI